MGHPMIPRTIEWTGDRVRLIDQRQLPDELVMVEASTVDELCELIVTLGDPGRTGARRSGRDGRRARVGAR